MDTYQRQTDLFIAKYKFIKLAENPNSIIKKGSKANNLL
jgi:hypothetical protein